MKIGKNTSHYDTKKLHSMFCFIHKQISKHEGKMPWWDDLNIHIRKKSSSYSGRAYLDKPWSKEWGMFLSMATDISVEQIAQLFAHELMHNYGYRHHQFNRHPLTEQEVAEVKNKFSFESLLSESGKDYQANVKKKKPSLDYYEACMDLQAEHSWLHFYVKTPGYNHDQNIEVTDERLDFEYFYDDWLAYTDGTWTWCQAYNFAHVLIEGNVQKHKTENYTVGMNADWEE